MNPITLTLIGLAAIGLMLSLIIRLSGVSTYWGKSVVYVGGLALFFAGQWLWNALSLPLDWPQLLLSNFQWWFPFAVLLPGIILLAIFEWMISYSKRPPAQPEE